MKRSLKAFLKEIIDYAGLFPPAKLPLDTAIQNFSDYRKSDDSWMLSRFIIPASRLNELEMYDSLFREDAPFEFSVLGKGTETVDDFNEQLDEIVGALNRFHQTHGRRVTTDILEIKLPREVVFSHDTDSMQHIFAETASRMGKSEKLPGRVFFEGYFEESWKKDISCILETLNKFNADHSHKSFHYSAFKIRCGGVEAHMFPSAEQLGFAINRAKEQNIALKCTAGLHHPVRHYADSVKTKMHGFFNVFGGTMLSYANDLSDEELVNLLKEEDADHFSFTDEKFQWKDFQISTHEISELRETALISFGSCSFDEPREDLQTLGLM